MAYKLNPLTGKLDYYDPAGSQSQVDANTTHRTGDGSDHTFIDQDVTTTSSPTHNKLQLTPQTSPSYNEGLTFYDSTKKALSYYNEISDVTVNLGQEVLFKVENQSGDTIENGTVVTPCTVCIINKADASIKDKCRIVAVMTHSIDDGETGYATKLGQVGGLDTSLYAPGTVLYLSATTPGAFTDIRPDDGHYSVIIGVVDVQDDTDGIITVDTKSTDTTVEVTDTNGFPPLERTNTSLSIDDIAMTFTITPSGSMFHFYELGDKYEVTGADTVSFTDTEGEWWIYYNDGVLTASVNLTNAQKEHVILVHAFVSFFFWDAVNKKVTVDIADERHGISMSPRTHLYLHSTRGAQYRNGISPGDFVIGDGSLNTHSQFSISTGAFFDEDISHTVTAKSVGDTIPVVYNLGSTSLLRSDTQSGFAVLNAPAGRLYYNEWTGTTWQLTEVPNNDFVLYHIFAVNGVNEQLIAIMGQNEYGNRGQARVGANEEIANILSSLPLNEYVPIASIIFQTNNGYLNTTKSKIVQTDTGEDYVDWRVTELAQGTAPSDHNNLTNLQLAQDTVTWGHVDDQAQTIAGSKTFTGPAFTVPRITTSERNALTPINGMIIYNTDSVPPAFNFYEDDSWVTK